MIIDQLPNGAPFSTSDEVAVEKGQKTYKGKLQELPFMVKTQSDLYAFISADYDHDQVLTLWQKKLDDTAQYGLVIAKTYIGLYDSKNSTWLWRTPLMNASMSAWGIGQGGTGGGTAEAARTNLEIENTSTEALTNSYLNLTAIRNNAGMKFIRCSTRPGVNLEANTDYSLGTLSAPYRPRMQVIAYLMVNTNVFALLTITTSGAVTFRPLSAIPSTAGINIHYAYL